jgi:hypothetical protein
MPFSTTKSTSEGNWTLIYEKLIKPAVEGSGLDFECERSKATRGNMVKRIIYSLNDSDIVIADLTDHNPNVCYELGLRHGLKSGTILLAQNRSFLNIFDLHNYASHVYDWKSRNGRQEMISKIRELLLDYLQNPAEPDSPVQDFLQEKPSFRNASTEELEDIIEIDNIGEPHILIPPKKISAKDAIGFILLASGEKTLSMNELTELLSKNWKRQKANQVSATIASMKGLIVPIGSRGNYRYRLSVKGREEMLRIMKILKQN